MRAIWRILEGRRFLPLVLLAGCAGPTFTPDAAPAFVVTREKAPFYRLGPQQAGPPDARLAVDDRLRMLRREFGYSFMLRGDRETGYVANEDLAPAPVLPEPVVPPPEQRESASPRRAALPPVEVPLPKPDLSAEPDDAPAL